MHRRFISKPIRDALADTPVNLIVGPRQVGKSTLCAQLIEEGLIAGALVTLDDLVVLEGAKNDPPGFLKALNKQVIIDEVQRVPELLLCIKKMVDDDRKNVRIVLTGSSNVMLLPNVADSLAGRIEIHYLWPLSEAEIKGKSSSFLDTLLSGSAAFATEPVHWDKLIHTMVRGGFPEALERSNAARRRKWFEAYIRSMLQKDMKDLSRIEGLSDIPKILHMIAIRVGSRINFSEIGRLADVKTPTLHRYLALLEHLFLIVKLPAWTPNADGQYVKLPKVYMNDSGLLCHLRGDVAEGLLTNRMACGNIVENFAIMEVMKLITWHEEALQPYHFSIHKGAEVDLVLEDGRKQLYGIEVKSTAAVNTDDFKGLRKLAEVAGEKFKRGIVLYTGEHVVGGFGNDMLAVPMSALWM